MMVVNKVRLDVVTVVHPDYSEFDLTLLLRPPFPEDWRCRFGDPLGRGVSEVACDLCCALGSCHADVMNLDANVRHGLLCAVA